MDGKELNELRELVEFLKANAIAEFDMERSDLKVRIKFAGEAPAGGANGVAAATSPTITFSEPVHATSFRMRMSNG